VYILPQKFACSSSLYRRWQELKTVQRCRKWNQLGAQYSQYSSSILFFMYTFIGPKHVEVINKIDEIYWEYCAPRWFHLQYYIKIHGQQNKKKVRRWTERCSRVLRDPLYLRAFGFWSRFGDWYTWFLTFSQKLQTNTWIMPWIRLPFAFHIPSISLRLFTNSVILVVHHSSNSRRCWMR
jgi:hypothetical protein